MGAGFFARQQRSHPMAISTSEGTKVYIGPATTAEDESALAALSYVEVGHVETVGEFDPQAQDVAFTPLSGGVQHLKGSIDNGTVAFSCARDPLDAGQIAVKAAMSSKLEYAVKIVFADAADGNDTDSIFYARGPIMSGRTNPNGANNVTMFTWGVGNTVLVEDASEAVSA
jgi:hypothetical protein